MTLLRGKMYELVIHVWNKTALDYSLKPPPLSDGISELQPQIHIPTSIIAPAPLPSPSPAPGLATILAPLARHPILKWAEIDLNLFRQFVKDVLPSAPEEGRGAGGVTPHVSW